MVRWKKGKVYNRWIGGKNGRNELGYWKYPNGKKKGRKWVSTHRYGGRKYGRRRTSYRRRY